jgi:hypothetical protein
MRTAHTEGRTIQQPPLRRVLVQMEPSLHRRLTSHAQSKQVSLETVILHALRREIDQPVVRYPEPPPRDEKTASLLRANLLAVGAAIVLGVLLVVLGLVLGW